MKALENQTYLIAYIISNVLAIIFLITSIRLRRLSRLLYVVLFGWASWANWNMAISKPHDYLSYADLTFLPVYKTFILGWFSEHILISVGFVATAQALVAIALMMKGWVYKLGLIAGTMFLIAIIPLGVGSAFPCTLLLELGLVMLRKEDSWLWQQTGTLYHTGMYNHGIKRAEQSQMH